jgi:hypothetical protein
MLNYFNGFVTYKQIMKLITQPLRSFRISVTKEWISTKKRLEEERRRLKEAEEAQNKPLSKYEEVQMKKKASSKMNLKVKEGNKSNLQVWEREARLNVPDFYDY